MDYGYSYTIGGRIGVLSLDRSALLYVLAGYTRLEMDGVAQVHNSVNFRAFNGKIDTGYSANPISVNLPDSFDGFTVGIGTQVKLAQGVSLKLEGRHTDLESKSVQYSGSTDKEHRLLVHNFGPHGCGNFLNKNDDNCASVLRKTASSSGVINVDPDLWSARVLLSIDF